MNTLKKWCNEPWLYVVYGLGLLMFIILIIKWNDFSVPHRVMYLITILLLAHVFEENTFPGGFFYANNGRFGSKNPYMYPQNMLTNMVTNLGAEIFFMILAFNTTKIEYSVMSLAVVFGLMECVGHMTSGIKGLKKYKSKGKKTIYDPGLVTSLIGLLGLAVYSMSWLAARPFELGHFFMGVGYIAFVAICLILIPFAISLKVKSERFAFTDAGYYEKYNK